MVIILTRPD